MDHVNVPKDLEVFMNYRRLRHVERCNTLPRVISQDVAQHSYYVALLAMAIGDEYNLYATNHNLEFHPLDFDNLLPEVKMEIVLRKALLHDTEEAIVSDIPWNVKHSSEEVHQVIQEAIEAKIREFYEGSNTCKDYMKLGIHCKDGLEGELVNIADMLELALYCWEECNQLGNKALVGLRDKAFRLVKDFVKNSSFGDVMYEASPLFNSIMMVVKGTFDDSIKTMFSID